MIFIYKENIVASSESFPLLSAFVSCRAQNQNQKEMHCLLMQEFQDLA